MPEIGALCRWPVTNYNKSISAGLRGALRISTPREILDQWAFSRSRGGEITQAAIRFV